MRLVKYLANAGVASRRAAEQIIFDGRVRVDDEVVTDPARDVDSHMEITVDHDPVMLTDSRLVYALNKPSGVVSTAKDTHDRPTVVDLVPNNQRLYPVGRLDVDATGLILLTNDGDLAHRLTHPSFEVDKTYIVTVGGGPVQERAIMALREGVRLDDGMTAPARVDRVKSDTISITIHEGRNRQVKRMCEATGHRVKTLQRVRFGTLSLGTLKLGTYRRLRPDEINQLAAGTPESYPDAEDIGSGAATAAPRPAAARPRSGPAKSKSGKPKRRAGDYKPWLDESKSGSSESTPRPGDSKPRSGDSKARSGDSKARSGDSKPRSRSPESGAPKPRSGKPKPKASRPKSGPRGNSPRGRQ